MLSILGLGDWLHSLDPSRLWEEHLQYVLIFCKVHVIRNFRKRFPKHEAQTWVQDRLWQYETREQVLQQMDRICAAYPELKTWLKSKQKDWILAALCRELSKVQVQWWTHARKHSGVAESSHFSDNNISGRKNTLLGGIFKCVYAMHILRIC